MRWICSGSKPTAVRRRLTLLSASEGLFSFSCVCVSVCECVCARVRGDGCVGWDEEAAARGPRSTPGQGLRGAAGGVGREGSGGATSDARARAPRRRPAARVAPERESGQPSRALPNLGTARVRSRPPRTRRSGPWGWAARSAAGSARWPWPTGSTCSPAPHMAYTALLKPTEPARGQRRPSWLAG